MYKYIVRLVFETVSSVKSLTLFLTSFLRYHKEIAKHFHVYQHAKHQL